MDTLLSVDEKYLQVLEELYCGELPKAFRLLNEILAAEPAYARAHFQMARLQHEQFRDLRAAGYHYQQCEQIDPDFPDVYLPYLKLCNELGKHKLARTLGEKGLRVAGTDRYQLCKELARSADLRREYNEARELLNRALLHAHEPEQEKEMLEQLKTLNSKMKRDAPFVYRLEE
ncbi:hypothetical protein C7T94_05500 [Pedobacter yulinensis]|uniref:Tetratricopeptide repeat protein n=1 Tax=Pedobacter yulinensis TaxID=2126353 RepID=A0A2T3HP72_9SPHI|nr:hypothetical protein [Pedobacter yulinensis]PST84181.1 hypothetical protein C7T94_05500 [Pedobacter yulinensis]